MGMIGQSLPIMAETTDYICPMVYPSHYGAGYMGFDNPASHPYDVILGTMQMGLKQIPDSRARLRPWLQDFTLVWVPDNMIVSVRGARTRSLPNQSGGGCQNRCWLAALIALTIPTPTRR
jgi:hypothetical protein